MRFRKKPVVIEAAMFDGVLVGDPVNATGIGPTKVAARTCPEWFPAVTREAEGTGPVVCEPGQVMSRDDRLYIGTTEGTMEASPGDWIIKGTKGELYPCKPDVFAEVYAHADG